MKVKEEVFFTILMVIYMKDIGKMMNQMEKEFFILIMVKDLKGIGKIIRQREKEFIIIIMVIEKWVIILMAKRLESM